jgi:hypothetical protein
MLNLNDKVKGKEATNGGDFTPIPKDRYAFKVKEVKPWKAKTQNINVIVKDDKGYTKKDDKGNTIKELKKDVTYYNADISLEVIDGEYKGRLVFGNITTHPNAEFITENFVYAIGLDEVELGKLPHLATGKTLDAEVSVNEEAYKYEENKVTGQKDKVISPKNEIDKFFRTELKLDDGDADDTDDIDDGDADDTEDSVEGL